MKYYCENCMSTIDVTEIELWNCEPLNPDCPFCIGKKAKPIPAHETVAAWEKRKGREYPDTAPVYVNADNMWHLVEFAAWRADFINLAIVATEAGAPPDDWRPEC